jgi:TolB-like protein/Flp pilus assembly protein TadD
MTDSAPPEDASPPALAAKPAASRWAKLWGQLKRFRGPIAAIAAFGAILSGLLGYWSAYQTVEKVVIPKSAPASVVPAKSIAVLPFVDMSEKKDQEYFSDGLSEELLDRLSRVPELHVAARTSAFSFKGKSDDIPTIARKLLVANVLEGSVRKSGNRLRITVQLVQADTGYHLWSETYDRTLDDIFNVQNEIASAVVNALKVSLLAEAVPKGTANTDAYILYLQARSIYLRASAPADLEKVADYLQQVLKLDPTFAPAWAFFATVRSAQAGIYQRKEGWEEGRRAARQALSLDPRLPAAHTAMAKIQLLHDWDWAGAQAQINEALEVDPGNASALTWEGYLSWVMGQLEKAHELLQRSVAIDPLNPYAYLYFGIFLKDAGQLDEAQIAIRKSLDLNPAAIEAHLGLALLLLARSDPTAALAEIERENDEGKRQFGRALIFHALGRKADADSALADLEKKYAGRGGYDIARVHAFRGDVDQAFAWLDRAYKQRDYSCAFVKSDSLLKNLWPDPRYKGFLRKIKLPD